jgi:low temperature requirement protein LtrA
MPKIEVRPSHARGEGAGFLASLAFTTLASVRDVYFGGVFQSTSPRLNDAGVAPTALVSVRFVGAVVLAVALALSSRHELSTLWPRSDHAVVLGTMLLIVFPIFVSQVGISLASPLTVRAVLALGPVLIFWLQLVEGRLSASPYSLAVGVLYGIFAVSAALARRKQSALSVVVSPSVPCAASLRR